MPTPRATEKSSAPEPASVPPSTVVPRKLSIWSCEPPKRPVDFEILDHHAGDRAFQPRAGGAHRAVDHRILERARHVGADRDRAREIDQLDAGQPPQRVGGAVVAQLRAASASGRAARQSEPPPPSGATSAWARPIVRPSLAATARIAARPPSSRALRPISTGREDSTRPARVRPRMRRFASPLGRAPGAAER